MQGGPPARDPLQERLLAEVPYLRGLLGRLMGTPGAGADREDMLQEVLSRALRYRGSFDQQRALRPWLRVTTLRVWFDHREGEQRAPLSLGELGEEPAVSAACDFEVADSLSVLLRPLLAVERNVLLRFHRDGTSVREIAIALDLPEGTVKSHLHRARRKLASIAPPEETP